MDSNKMKNRKDVSNKLPKMWYKMSRIIRIYDEVQTDVYITFQRGDEENYFLPVFKRISVTENFNEEIQKAESLAISIISGGYMEEEFESHPSIKSLIDGCRYATK